MYLTRHVLPMGINVGDLNNGGFLDFYLGTGYPEYEVLIPNVIYVNWSGKKSSDVNLQRRFRSLAKKARHCFCPPGQ